MNWILPAIVDGFRTLKDKTIRVTITTNELTPEQQMELFESQNSFGFLAFNEDAFKTKEIEILEGLEADYNDQRLKPSQRFRNVLYRLWEKDNNGYKDFSKYYDFKMDQLINHYKSLI